MGSTQSPLDIAAWALGLVLGIPTLVAAVKVIYFVAEARTKLDACVSGQDELKRAFYGFKHEIRNVADEHDKRILLVERDVDHLKESAA